MSANNLLNTNAEGAKWANVYCNELNCKELTADDTLTVGDLVISNTMTLSGKTVDNFDLAAISLGSPGTLSSTKGFMRFTNIAAAGGNAAGFEKEFQLDLAAIDADDMLLFSKGIVDMANVTAGSSFFELTVTGVFNGFITCALKNTSPGPTSCSLIEFSYLIC